MTMKMYDEEKYLEMILGATTKEEALKTLYEVATQASWETYIKGAMANDRKPTRLSAEQELEFLKQFYAFEEMLEAVSGECEVEHVAEELEVVSEWGEEYETI